MKNKKPCGPIFSEEQRLVLLHGFQKQNTYTTVAEYAKANNVSKSTLRGWSVRYGMPLGWHHRNHRKILPKEQKLALLDGFQKQSTHTTIESYAKANNVRKDALRRWAVLYGMPLGHHYTKRIQKTPSTNVIKKKPIHDDPLLEALRKQHRISQ
jgi:phage-related protein